MAMNLPVIFSFLLATLCFFSASEATTLTIHNLCPYPVWPLITPNTGLPAISGNAARLDTDALLSVPFPATAWAGRVTARAGCGSGAGAGASCGTGAAPPFTVAQIQVHDGRDADEAGYSVSLVEGFNVPMVISHQGGGSGLCPPLGCAVDLNFNCPPEQRAAGGAACRGPPGYFKSRCPLTRTTAPDKEPRAQSCRSPGELRVVLCQKTDPSMLQEGAVVEADG